jgi:hypothetical protein
MRAMLAEIAKSASDLRSHPFFSSLRPEPDLKRMLAFAPAGTFWVMTFQDIIVMNAELTVDPTIRALVERHRDEDTGHERWFLADLERIFGEQPSSVLALFSHETRRVRTVSFGLAAEVFNIRHDVLRLVFLEVLEAAAGVYFAGISQALRLAGHADKLKYFAGEHLQAEASHELHGVASDPIQAIVLSPQERDEARQLSQRMFGRFTELGSALLESFDPPRSNAPAQPQGEPATNAQ